MMNILALFSACLALALSVLAAPHPQSLTPPSLRYYTLRANATKEPWNTRPIVPLPTSHRLGLANFTTHPAPTPLKLTPIQIVTSSSTTWALQGPAGDDLSRTPFLAAIINPSTHTVSMQIVHLPSPLQASFAATPDACPEGCLCAADQWTFDVGEEGELRNLGFGEFKGKWVPFRDAGREGWTVYWKGNAGLRHAVQIDLVVLE